MRRDLSSIPLVSVVCITYNQVGYVRECLDGFLMQKTNFKFEILVHDDASTDGTADIIKEYQLKYPDLFFPIYQRENQFSKGVKGILITFVFPMCKGKYIALCEGDDFWTDPNKLQLQVDFLEKNPNYSVCFHPVKVFFENHEKDDSIYPANNNKSDFTLKKLLKANFIQTNSVVYRKQDYSRAVTNVSPGDWYLHLYHTQFGKIGFINKVMSAYRRHPGGIWWLTQSDPKEFWRENGLQHLLLYKELLGMYGENQAYREIILSNTQTSISSIIDSDNSKDKSLVMAIVNDFPELITDFSEFTKNVVLNKNTDIKEKENTIIEKENTIIAQSKEIENISREIKKLEGLLDSWDYKVGKLVSHPLKTGKHVYRKLIKRSYISRGKK